MTPLPPDLDEAKLEEFAGEMTGVMKAGALAIMSSIGHRTGLFDTLAGLAPSTSQQIADAAGLNERYVREWLGAMVTGGVVDYDPETKTYCLPPEHAASLTRAAGPYNIARRLQVIPLLATVEDKIVQCFENGGGVPYEEFGRFHDVMAERSVQLVGAALLDTILPLAPGLTDRLRDGIRVLDVGCGSGHALNIMAEAFPRSTFTGYDLSEEGVGNGNEQAREKGLTNLEFAVQDVTHFPTDAPFDFITAFDAIHDQKDPVAVLSNISGALADNGVYIMQDIAASSYLHKNQERQIGTVLYTISTMHCMTVSLAQGGAGLGAVWGEELACDMLRDAGFRTIDINRIPTDPGNNYYVCGK